MLPFFFRHYDRFVDRYVIFDDGSTDNSPAMLTGHPRVELRRFVRSEPGSFALSEQALSNQVTGGFQFKLGGAVSTAIPGPSGIFLRIKYNPATINKILDYVVTKGPGAEGGKGIFTGIADTAIYAFVSATEKRNDFGGYF